MDPQWSGRVDDTLAKHGDEIMALRQRVAVHEEKHRTSEAWLESMADDVKAIRGWMENNKGGKAMVAMLGIPAAIMAAIGAGLHWLVTGGK